MSSMVVSMFPANPVAADICATALSGGIALSMLRFWEETAKRGFFDQKLNRKLVHISVGLVFMLCWPLFRSGNQGAILAALIPGVNIIKMLLIGLGIWKDEATVKSMSRFGDHRELLKGPLYYALTITLACAIYWRTSPIAIAAVCNLCAGDGSADIVGRRFGHLKLPYNSNKSIAGSVAMVTAGFVSSVIYMHYFSSFGYMRESWEMVLGFLMVSLAAALVESLPISTDLDDNLTVPFTSILLFWQVTDRFIQHGVRTTMLLNELRAFFIRIASTGTLATRNNEGEEKNKYQENKKGNYKSDQHDLAVQGILCVVGEEKIICLIPIILWSHSRQDWLL